MNRAQAQKRSGTIRNIRGCHAQLKNAATYGSDWMPGNQKEKLLAALVELEDLVGWLDSIRSERARIRAGELCKTCKKPFDFLSPTPRDGFCQCK